MEKITALFYIFYIVTNHAFNKIGVLMNKELDNQLKLAEGSNWLTLITSTILAAFGKIFGSFVEITSIRYTLVILFLLNGISMYTALNTSNFTLFFWARNIQGFVSGLQTSVIIGFISLLKNNKVGFANFTGISALVSLLISILIQYIKVTNISLVLLLLNVLASIIFFIKLRKFNQTYKKIPIIYENIKNSFKIFRFNFYAISLGIILAAGLFIIQKQPVLLNNLCLTKNRFFFTSFAFVVAGLVSFYSKLQKNIIGLIIVIFGLVCFIFGIKYKILTLVCMGCSSGFVGFSAVSPVICHGITKIIKDKFVSSSLFFGIRSFFTAFGLWFFGFLEDLLKINTINMIILSLYLIIILSLCCVLIELYDKNFRH